MPSSLFTPPTDGPPMTILTNDHSHNSHSIDMMVACYLMMHCINILLVFTETPQYCSVEFHTGVWIIYSALIALKLHSCLSKGREPKNC